MPKSTPTSRTTTRKKTLFSRLGGEEALRAVVAEFYSNLLKDPELQGFFEGVNLEWLQESQVAFLSQALGGPKKYTGRDMEAAHQRLEIRQADFDLVAGHFVGALDAFDIDDQLMAEVVAVIAPLAAEIVNCEGPRSIEEDAALLFSMTESAPINIMCADREGTIQYLNKKSLETLEGIKHLLPVAVEEIRGGSMDVFHEDPAHQRELIKDDTHLPMEANISLGEEKLQLVVNPMYSSSGEYVGPMVTWEVITEKIKRENEIAQVRSMIENAPVNIMCADREGTIQFMNPKSLETLKSLAHVLPVPPEKVLGGSMDVFHQNPSHQRSLIKDDSRLPMHSEIKIADETLDLLVTAMYDAGGTYLGPMVTWSVITEKLAQEAALAEAQERERQAAEELRGKVDAILEVVEAAADGDLTREVPVMGDDAVGRMGAGLARLLGTLRESIEQIAQNSQTLASASEELSAVSQEMSASSEETSTQAQVVANASKEVSENVQTVAAGTEELSASIEEISKSAQTAAQIAREAVEAANQTNRTISKLGESSEEIGAVIKVITSIAQQTNLLALNATIEAARAGEAGKSFAVVANEVKELAKETANATEDISSKIVAIQGDTKESVQAIENISQIISTINDTQNSIASAVEEQAATTGDMARNVNNANTSTNAIVTNIEGVAGAADETSRGAAGVRTASSELAEMASKLEALVSRFKF
jgi:methyl-accepting chemotaxis protein